MEDRSHQQCIYKPSTEEPRIQHTKLHEGLLLKAYYLFDLGEGWSSDSHEGLREGKVKNWAFFGVVGTNILLSCAVLRYRYCSVSFGLFTVTMAIGDHNISNANKLDQPDCLSVEQA